MADLEEAEAEERNLKFYTDMDALVEWYEAFLSVFFPCIAILYSN